MDNTNLPSPMQTGPIQQPVQQAGLPPADPSLGSDTASSGGGINWGNLFGSLGGLYGAGTNAVNSQGLINAGNAGFGMASNAYNPSLFGMNGVGGSGFSLTSPNGGPGSISSTLGAFNPMYGAYAGGANQYLNNSLGLANTASTGATGAYQSALASIMPQLQNMQGNLLASNNNALFQRGQLGSGSYGQYGSNGNPVNLTTQSLGSGFALQDLNAITAAQNQGLNFFNSNMAGATGLGNLGLGTTNTGLGFIGAQNATGQLPLAYSQLYGGQQLGATNANANTIGAVAGRNGINLGGGYGGLATGLGGGLTGGASGILGQLGSATGATGPNGWLSNLFGGGSPAGGVGGGLGGGASLFGGYNPGSSVFSGAPGATSVDFGGVSGGAMPTAGGAADTSFLSDMGGLGAATAPIESPALMGLGGADAGAAAGLGTGGIDTMGLAQTGYASLGGVPGSLAAADTSAGAGAAAGSDAASSGAAGASSLAIPLAALAATYWAGGRGTNVNTSGLMSALQAGPNGNPGYAGDVLEASSLAGNWGGAQGGYGGLNVDASGLGQWLSQNGYGTPLGNVNPNTPWSSNPIRSLVS